MKAVSSSPEFSHDLGKSSFMLWLHLILTNGHIIMETESPWVCNEEALKLDLHPL